MKRNNYAVWFAATLVFMGCWASPFAWAAGPLVVVNGQPVRWDVQTITYRVDSTRLGSLSNPIALNLVDRAFRSWQDVPGAAIRFTRAPQPLSGSERSTVIQRLTSGQQTGMNPIIFDEDGSIVDSMFGTGARNQIIGFAGPIYSGNRIIEARAVFNGRFFQIRNSSQEEILSTMLHEFGHMCGLDHAQHSRHLAGNAVNADDVFLPVMFPTNSDDDARRTELTFDDRIAISNLYPSTLFPINTGRIAGVVSRGASELPGVNVIARNVSNPIEQISTTVTGTFNRNRGIFELAGLPDGEYELLVEAIDSRFFSSSSVGQYAQSSNDRSFQNPVRSQYFSASGGRSTISPVRVRAGQTTRDININVASQSLPNDERNAVLLPIDSTMIGGAGGSRVYRDAFLLVPNGNEERLIIQFDFRRTINYLIEVARETSPGQRSVGRFEATNDDLTIVLGPGGDIPLQATRYFFSITNRSSAEVVYEITVTSAPAPTPTPTFTPTPTNTPTPSPTLTPSPTPLADSTPTPIPIIPPTPTPLPIHMADLTGNGRIDALDLMALSQDWGLEPEDRIFNSRLTPGEGPVGWNDLLLWLRYFHESRK